MPMATAVIASTHGTICSPLIKVGAATVVGAAAAVAAAPAAPAAEAATAACPHNCENPSTENTPSTTFFFNIIRLFFIV